MNPMTKKTSKILGTNDIIKLIKQDQSLYNKGLEKVGNAALLNVLKNRFKITNFYGDFDKIRAELAKRPRKRRNDILLYNAVVLLNERLGKIQIAEGLGCSVATINKILKGE